MDDKRNGFTFIWKIKNLSFCFNGEIGFKSPIFFVQAICQSKWNLNVYTISETIKGSIECRLERQVSDNGPHQLELDYELSFITDDGSVIHSEIFRNKTYIKGYIDFTSSLCANRVEVFMNKKKLFIPNNTLTIRCRMWRSQESISKSARCSVETRIKTECRYLVGCIEKFNSLKTNSVNNVCFKSLGIRHPYDFIHLCVGEDVKLDIKIYLQDCRTCKLNFFILNAFKHKLKAWHKETCFTQLLYIPLNLSKDYIIENQEIYLSYDVLTLEFEIFYPSGDKVEIMDDMLYEYNCQDTQAVNTNATNKNQFSEEQNTESIASLKDGLISLLKEGVLCDTKLKTATETFPAHTVVLSAQSPVFKSMFTTEMREKTKSCVDIEDLDADTVRKMLLFMYSDTLNNLDYESSKSLYFAADKYNIVPLKQKCSNFLRQNLVYPNCCEVLLLADRHQDKDIKRYVRDCIAENDEAVFSSKEWKNLVESHPRLTTEILLDVYSYMKNRKT